MRDDIQRADADRAGRTEHGHAAREHSLEAMADHRTVPRGGDGFHDATPNSGLKCATNTSKRQRDAGEDGRIHPVEHAAMARDQVAAILDAETAA